MDASGPGRTGLRFLERRIGAETVVYDPAAHRAYCLGPVASAVWRAWEPGASVARIASRVAAEIGEPVEPLAVAVALRRLERAGLQRPTPAPRGDQVRGSMGPAAGRREALRRVAALAGLTVAALVIPAPGAVACSVQPGQPCQTSSQCCPTAGGNPTCCGRVLRRCIPTSIANCGP